LSIRIRLFAVLFLSMAAAVSGEEKIIKGTDDLNAVSAYLPSAVDRTLTIRIDNYSSPGQLRIGLTNAKLDTIIIKRYSNDSDAAVKVDSTLIDAKGFTGTLVLKNIAFRLSSKGILIAGFDLNKANRNLILDSCYLYADTLDGAFVSWQGDALSKVEIKNSWFVGRTSSTNAASINIAAANATLRNCLFNFSGTITASVSTRFDALSNTVNRLQFKLTGNSQGGPDPIYSFSQNLFAFPGPLNGLGGDPFYALKASGFNEASSSIQSNRMYALWRGFDSPAGAKGIAGLTQVTNAPYNNKVSTELWDWYTDQFDSGTGMLSGNAGLQRFNVLPGTDSAVSSSGTDTLTVFFRKADFPRSFRLSLGAQPLLADSAYRLRDPYAGSLSFGPFQVSQIRHNPAAANGKPLLLALSPDGIFIAQASQAKVLVGPSIFQNNTPSARVFALVDSGNTPHGSNVSPSHSSFEKFEGLTFAEVEQAGQTTPKSPGGDNKMPDSLRFLNRVFGFQTSATVNTSFVFKTAKYVGARPWSQEGDNGLLWYLKSKGSTVKALPGTAPGDSLLYGSIPAFSNTDGIFFAYLVEKLSIHAGDGFRMPLETGAYLLSYSKNGYQAYPEAYAPDAANFDSISPGYSFTWIGRGAGDSAFYMVKRPSPSALAYVMVPGRSEPDFLVPQPKVDSAGYFRIPLDSADAGKSFFAALKYNVVAGQPPFRGVVDGVSVSNLVSSRSGRLGFRDLPLADARKLGDNPDSVFKNANYLGGKEIQASKLAITAIYNLAFPIGKFQNPDKVEIWWLEKGSWRNSSASGHVSGDSGYVSIAGGASHFVIVERFQAPDMYFKDSLAAVRDSLIVILTPKLADTGPVLAYCVEMISIHRDGTVAAGACEKKSPAQATRIKLDTANAYAYRIVYYEGTPDYSVQLPGDFVYPPQFGWSAKAILKDPAFSESRSIPAAEWRLVSFTAAGKLKTMIDHVTPAGTEKFRDTTVVWGLKNLKDGSAAFDTAIRFDTLNIGPASAYLLASSRPIALDLDSLANLPRRTPKPETLSLNAGWSLVGNPYPIPLNRKSVRLKSGSRARLLELVHKGKGYGWDSITTALKPFRGFAVYLEAKDVMFFDPSDTGSPAPAKSAVAKAAAGSSRVRVGIEASFGEASMALVRGAGEYPIRYLPQPSPGLELRVGAAGGYWILPVDDLGRIDQPVEVASAQDGIARFSLGEDGRGPAFALIDQATGMVYDAAAAASLPVGQGTRSYRLVAGDPAFVAEKAGAYLAGAPAEMALSQNFPNPARGLTRIAVAWPATRERDRRAFVEVLDLRGRRLALRRLDEIRVGRQVIELDAGGWEPGLYVYRLVVTQGGRVTRLQRRMLVAP
jgi:hypothetical protein